MSPVVKLPVEVNCVQRLGKGEEHGNTERKMGRKDANEKKIQYDLSP